MGARLPVYTTLLLLTLLLLAVAALRKMGRQAASDRAQVEMLKAQLAMVVRLADQPAETHAALESLSQHLASAKGASGTAASNGNVKGAAGNGAAGSGAAGNGGSGKKAA